MSESKCRGQKKVRDEPDRPTIGCCVTLNPMRVSVVGVPFWLRKFGPSSSSWVHFIQSGGDSYTKDEVLGRLSAITKMDLTG